MVGIKWTNNARFGIDEMSDVKICVSAACLSVISVNFSFNFVCGWASLVLFIMENFQINKLLWMKEK